MNGPRKWMALKRNADTQPWLVNAMRPRVGGRGGQTFFRLQRRKLTKREEALWE